MGQDRLSSTNSFGSGLTGFQMRYFSTENVRYLLRQFLEFSRVHFRFGFLAEILPAPLHVGLHRHRSASAEVHSPLYLTVE
jgi:hypothetical protein